MHVEYTILCNKTSIKSSLIHFVQFLLSCLYYAVMINSGIFKYKLLHALSSPLIALMIYGQNNALREFDKK